MSELPPIEKAMITPQRVEFVNGPQYYSTYSNNISYATNQLDFVLVFGEVVDMTQERALVEKRVRVTMHPIQAKLLRNILESQIENYESKNGPIPDTESFMVSIKDLK